jgi:transcriptional regulator with XRE-family HTH domain
MQLNTLDIAEALRLIRAYHSLKQHELAKMLSISKSQLSLVESGQRLVSLELLQHYANVLSIPASSILFFIENFKTFHSSQKVPAFVYDKIVNMLYFAAYLREAKLNA